MLAARKLPPNPATNTPTSQIEANSAVKAARLSTGDLCSLHASGFWILQRAAAPSKSRTAMLLANGESGAFAQRLGEGASLVVSISQGKAHFSSEQVALRQVRHPMSASQCAANSDQPYCSSEADCLRWQARIHGEPHPSLTGCTLPGHTLPAVHPVEGQRMAQSLRRMSPAPGRARDVVCESHASAAPYVAVYGAKRSSGASRQGASRSAAHAATYGSAAHLSDL